MIIIQSVLCSAFLLRIGGLLLKTVNVNDEQQWFSNFIFKNCSLLGMVISAYYEKGMISLILMDLCLIHFLLYEWTNKKSTKKVKIAYIIACIAFFILFTVTFFVKHGTFF